MENRIKKVIVKPAYGRVYRDAEQVKQHWNNQRDFMTVPFNGYVNIQDAKTYNLEEVIFDDGRIIVKLV